MDPVDRFRALRDDERWHEAEVRYSRERRALAAAGAPAPRLRWWAWAVPAVVVAAALAALAAFTLGGVVTLGHDGLPAAPTPSGVALATASPTATATPSATSPADAAPKTCVAGALSLWTPFVSPSPTEGTGGLSFDFALRNDNTAACLLPANPEVVWLADDGTTPMGKPAIMGGSSAAGSTKTIRVKPGALLYFRLMATDASSFPDSACRPHKPQAGMALLFPHQHQFPLEFGATTALSACAGEAQQLSISAFTRTQPWREQVLDPGAAAAPDNPRDTTGALSCTAADLRIGVPLDGGAAMGVAYQSFVATNVGDRPCWLGGYPTLLGAGPDLAAAVLPFAQRDGAVVPGEGASEKSATAAATLLEPGARASFMVGETYETTSDRCDLKRVPPYTELLVRLPNGGGTLELPFPTMMTASGCYTLMLPFSRLQQQYAAEPVFG